MSFSLKRRRIGSKAVRKICFEQIDRALGVLGHETIAPEDVHECRKVVKRIRAVLRLIEPNVNRKTFKDCYRGIGQVSDRLAHARERHVLEGTIAKLEARFGAEASGVLGPLKAAVAVRKSEVPHTVDAVLAAELKSRFEDERRRIAALRFKGKGFSTLAAGFSETYARARKNFRIARRAPADENLHELRKAVQWHWRQMALFASAWPEQFAVHIAACRQLAEILGDDHDLAMLASELNGIAGLGETDRAPITALAVRRQSELRQMAFPMCERLFAEKPAAFITRIRRYWRAKGKVSHAVEPVAVPANPPLQLNGGPKTATAPRLVAKAAKLEPSHPAS